MARSYRPRRRGKYKNEPTVIAGKTFASKGEAGRYLVLAARQAAGEIANLECQVSLTLQPAFIIGSARIRAITYIADYCYDEQGWHVIEDFKGARPKEYLLKRKLLLFLIAEQPTMLFRESDRDGCIHDWHGCPTDRDGELACPAPRRRRRASAARRTDGA